MTKDKRTCPICNEQMKGILNFRTSDFKAICKNCHSKISIEASKMNQQSLNDIKEHLIYREQNKKLLENYHVTKEIKTNFGTLKVDEVNKLWSYLTTKDNNPPLFRFNEIVYYEYLEDGETITKGGLGRSVAGGLLFGGVGAVVGGVTGGKKTKSIVSSMSVRVLLDNPYHSQIEIYILYGFKCKTGSMTYKSNKDIANRIITLFDDISKQEELEKQVSLEKTNLSGADELLKYKQLMDSGIISEEEFNEKKKQILGSC